MEGTDIVLSAMTPAESNVQNRGYNSENRLLQSRHIVTGCHKGLARDESEDPISVINYQFLAAHQHCKTATRAPNGSLKYCGLG